MAQLSLGITEQSVGLRNLWLLEVLFSWYLNLVVAEFKKKEKVNLRPVAMGRGGRKYTASPSTLAEDAVVKASTASCPSCCSQHI